MKGTEDLYTNTLAQQDRIVYTGPGEIFVPQSNNSYFSIYDSKYCSKEELIEKDIFSSDEYIVAPYSEPVGGGILNWADAKIDANSVWKLPDFSSGSDYWTTSNFTGANNCSPTAATNILWYWGMNRGKASISNHNSVRFVTGDTNKANAIHNILYTGMKTNREPDGKGGYLGGTAFKNVPDGFRSFFNTPASAGGTWNYVKIANRSSFSTYKAAVQNSCPVFLNLFTRDEGHSVMVIGTASSTTGVDYLFVMDGWNTYGRFVKLNYYSNTEGLKIWVR